MKLNFTLEEMENVVYFLNRIESALSDTDATPETEDKLNEAYLLTKKIKWHLRDGEALEG